MPTSNGCLARGREHRARHWAPAAARGARPAPDPVPHAALSAAHGTGERPARCPLPERARSQAGARPRVRRAHRLGYRPALRVRARIPRPLALGARAPARAVAAMPRHGGDLRSLQPLDAARRALGVPYLLRGDSGPHGQSGGIRGALRYAIARAVVSGSAGGLAVGHRNELFYARYGASRIVFAPHSVDNERFARPPAVGRPELLARWGLGDRYPVIMFCGKLKPAKRPLDLAAAVGRLGTRVTVLFVGGGDLAGQVGSMLPQGRGVVTGFVNQAELPSYYHAADILVLPSQSEPWGLVINEAMTAGVLPIVSDRVGCAPDLVAGLGEVYPCGDVEALTAALHRGLARIGDPGLAGLLRRRVDGYGIDATAAGFEQAVTAVATVGRRPSDKGPCTGRGSRFRSSR